MCSMYCNIITEVFQAIFLILNRPGFCNRKPGRFLCEEKARKKICNSESIKISREVVKYA